MRLLQSGKVNYLIHFIKSLRRSHFTAMSCHGWITLSWIGYLERKKFLSSAGSCDNFLFLAFCLLPRLDLQEFINLLLRQVDVAFNYEEYKIFGQELCVFGIPCRKERS